MIRFRPILVVLAIMHVACPAWAAEGEVADREEAVFKAVAALSGSRPVERWIEALDQLHDHPDPRALDVVIGYATARKRYPHVRMRALRALANFDAYRALTTLRRVSRQESDPKIRGAAAEALALHRHSRQLAAERATRVDDARIVDLLIQATSGGELDRARALGALSASGRDDVVPVLTAAVREGSGPVSAAAMSALSDREDPVSADALRSIWRDGAAPAARRREALSRLVIRSDSAAVDAAYEALEELGDSADPQSLKRARSRWAILHPKRAAARRKALARPVRGEASHAVLLEALLLLRSPAAWHRLRAGSWISDSAEPVLVPVLADIARRGGSTAERMRGVRGLVASDTPAATRALAMLARGDTLSDPVALTAQRGLAGRPPPAPVAKAAAETVAPQPITKAAAETVAPQPIAKADAGSGGPKTAAPSAVAPAPVDPTAAVAAAPVEAAEPLSPASAAVPAAPAAPAATEAPAVAALAEALAAAKRRLPKEPPPPPPPPPPDPRAGIALLAASSAILGSIWLESLGDAAQEERQSWEQWVAISSGALLGGGSALLITLRSDISSAEAGWFASVAGLTTVAGYMLPAGLELPVSGPGYNFTVLGAETVGLLGAALTFKDARLDTKGLLFMNGSALIGAATGLGVAMQFPDTGHPRRAFLPVTGGLLLGAVGGYAGALGEDLTPAERGVVAFSIVNSAAAGALAASSFHSQEALEAVDHRQLLGGAIIGGGLGFAMGITAGRLGDPTGDDLVAIAAGEALGLTLGLGGGLLASDLEARQVRGATFVGASLGAMGGIVIGPHIDLHLADAPVIMLGTSAGLATGWMVGNAKGEGRDRELSGGLITGANLGLIGSVALTQAGVRRTGGEAWVDGAGATVGTLGGQGFVLLLEDPSPWAKAGLRAAGLWSYLLATDALKLSQADLPIVALGAGEGLASGLLLADALGLRSGAGAAMVGVAGGAAIGGFGSKIWKPSAGRAAGGGAAGGVGLIGGWGWRLLDADHDPRQGAWVGLASMWGLTALYSQLHIDGADVPLFAVGTPMAMTTGWLLAETAGVRDDERQVGAAMLGLTAAATTLGPVSEVFELSGRQAGQAAVGASIGLLGAVGLELEQKLEEDQGAIAQILGMWGFAAAFSQYELQMASTPLLLLGTVAGGTTEFLGARAVGVREEARLGGSVMAGGAWGALGSGALSHWWRPTASEATTMGVTGVMGLLAGDGLARLIPDTDGDDVAAGQLAGMWIGLGAGQFVEPHRNTAPVSAFTGAVGAATVALTARAWGIRSDRRRGGALSFGLWSGGLAGALIAPHIDYMPERGARLVVGGAMGMLAGHGLADHFDGAGERAFAAGELSGLWAGLATGFASSATADDLGWVVLTTSVATLTEGIMRHGLDKPGAPWLGIGGGTLAGMLSAGRLSLSDHQSLEAAVYGGAGLASGRAWANLHASEKGDATDSALMMSGLWTGLLIGGADLPESNDAGLIVSSSLWGGAFVEHLERAMGTSGKSGSAVVAGLGSGLLAGNLASTLVDVPSGRAFTAVGAGAVGSVGGLGAAWMLGESTTSGEGTGQLSGLVAGTLLGATLELDAQAAPLIAFATVVGARTGLNLAHAADELTTEQQEGAVLFGGSVGGLAAATASRWWKPTGGQLGRSATAGLLGVMGSLGSRLLFVDASAGALALGEVGATWGGMTLGYLVSPEAADAPLMILSTGATTASAVLLSGALSVDDDERFGGAMLMGLSAGSLGGWALSHRYEASSSEAILDGFGGLAGWLVADGTSRLVQPGESASHAAVGLGGMWAGLLGVGLGLDPWKTSAVGNGAMGLLAFGGGLHGLGWGTVFRAEGDELRGAVELGAMSGLLGGAVLSLDPNLQGRRLLEVAGGNAMGSVLGGVTVGVFLPELGRRGALASTLAASYAGTAVGVLRPNEPSALAMAAAGGTVGFVAGHGGVRLFTDLGQAGGTALAVAGLTGGILGGGLLLDPWELTLGDSVVMAAATAYGGAQGYGWAEVADVSGRRKRGAAEIGVAIGAAGGTALARAYDMERSSVVLTLGSGGALMSIASGLAILAEDSSERLRSEHDKDYDAAIAAGLTLSAVGLGVGAVMSRYFELDGGELATTTVGAIWGVTQGSTWAAATDAGARKGAGAVLLGTGLGGIAGAILAENVKINMYRSLVLGSGAVWGGWLGLGGTYATGVPWKQSVVGGLAVANAGILTGLGLASRTQSLAQVGWVNVFGLAGMGVGTAVGVAVTTEPRARVATMVGGSMLGLVGGIVGTAYSDWWRVPGDNKPAAGSASGVTSHSSTGLIRMLKTTDDDAIVMPGVTWLPPQSGDGEPAPIFQVTVIH